MRGLPSILSLFRNEFYKFNNTGARIYMVGYTPGAELDLSRRQYALVGATSSAVARVVGQPLDVLKIRFQLQIEPISRNTLGGKYHGVSQAFKNIVREEGLFALWKGHVPAQVLSVVYGIVQFTAFEYLTKLVGEWLPESYTVQLRPLTHTVCGGLAACSATAAIQPLDVIRTRFVAQGEPKVYRSILHASQCILQKEGILGLYKGLVPAMMGVGPQMGMQFGLYAGLQIVWDNVLGLDHSFVPGIQKSFICGSGAGVLSKLAVYPFDMLKKRLQVQGFEEARRPFGQTREYSGLLHCVRNVIQEEGMRGLYKGLVPSLLKAAVVSGTIFCSYDRLCSLLRYFKTMKSYEDR